LDEVIQQTATWLRSDNATTEIRGRASKQWRQ
jgi:hypothetical protein